MPARNRKSVFGHAMGTAATITGATFFSAVLAAGACLAADKPELKDAKDKVNYSVGYQIGGDFRRQGIEISSEMLIQGIRDAAADATPRMSPQDMRKTLVALKASITAAERKRKTGDAPSDPRMDQAYLDEHGKQAGVVVLPDGLQYQVVREGLQAAEFLLPAVEAALQAHAFDGLAEGLVLAVEPLDDVTWARGAASLALDALFGQPVYSRPGVEAK